MLTKRLALTRGSVVCTCNSGYALSAAGVCSNINECAGSVLPLCHLMPGSDQSYPAVRCSMSL